MKLYLLSLFIGATFSSTLVAQEIKKETTDMPTVLPYYEIPEAPTTYSAGTVAARMVDGLGFRYYWATEGLRAEDLLFCPNEDARTTQETLEHILGLSTTILNTARHRPNVRRDRPEMSFEEMRKKTLENIKMTSDILRSSTDKDMEQHQIVFQRGDTSKEYPFWNLINGPIADAIWHTGQIVSFRRSSGNPFPSNVSVFSGKVRK